ncbi:MAG TPA: carbon monoxide dehydrogenase subunit G [Candidatus Limnocylindrales bacterium]|nr:carbon monoxide dehydrogenase subunit G [Candidatus Limnocylindrales bacterium]
MEFTGVVEIRAPRAKVWAFVMDPEEVGWCGPGVEAIEVVDATHYRARAKVGIGPISARFVVDLELKESVEPDRAVIEASGQAPGSAADAVGEIALSGPPDGPTTMAWTATVTISGTFASVGTRLIDSTADRLIGETFACIRAKLEA